MKKIYKVYLLLLLSLSSLPASAVINVQDWWWNPSMSGMGINIGQQDQTLTVSWYLYDDNKTPTFLLLTGNLNGNRLEGSLTRSTGPAPSPAFNPGEVQRSEVGRASIVFNSSNNATFSYSYNGKKDTIQLQRFTFKELSVDNLWISASSANRTGCSNPKFNGYVPSYGILIIEKLNNKNYDVYFTYEGDGVCLANMSLIQTGSVMSGTGAVTCDFGLQGLMEITSMRTTDDYLSIDYTMQMKRGEICVEKGKIAATPR